MRSLPWLLPLWVGLFLVPKLQAHALFVECSLRATKVEVIALYDDETPGREAHVWVVNAANEEIARGKTDANGRWSFARPTPGTYCVRVNAGGGHAAYEYVTIPSPSTSSKEAEPSDPQDLNSEAGSNVKLNKTSRRSAGRLSQLGLGVGIIVIAAVVWFCLRARREVEVPT